MIESSIILDPPQYWGHTIYSPLLYRSLTHTHTNPQINIYTMYTHKKNSEFRNQNIFWFKYSSSLSKSKIAVTNLNAVIESLSSCDRQGGDCGSLGTCSLKHNGKMTRNIPLTMIYTSKSWENPNRTINRRHESFSAQPCNFRMTHTSCDQQWDTAC